jgi:hypothetical protein
MVTRYASSIRCHLHVEQAAAIGGFSAVLGDARNLAEADASYEAVLMFGPSVPGKVPGLLKAVAA